MLLILGYVIGSVVLVVVLFVWVVHPLSPPPWVYALCGTGSMVVVLTLFFPLLNNVRKRGWVRFARKNNLSISQESYTERTAWIIKGDWKDRFLLISLVPTIHTIRVPGRGTLNVPTFTTSFALSSPTKVSGQFLPEVFARNDPSLIPEGAFKPRMLKTGEPQIDVQLSEKYQIYGFEGIPDHRLLPLEDIRALLSGFNGRGLDQIRSPYPRIVKDDRGIILQIDGMVLEEVTMKKILDWLYNFLLSLEA
jgi:hypothetical protein